MAYGSGIVDPHQGVDKDKNNTSSENPPETEVELAKQIDKLFQKYAKHRKKYDKEWVANYKFYRGYQYGKTPSYQSREVINMIFRTIQGQTSVMMDARPTVGFLPREPSDIDFSEILNQVFQADWERNEWMMELLAILLDGEIYSVGYGYTGYDVENGVGRKGIEWCCTDPFSCYPDPDATDVNKKAEGFIYAEPVDLDKLRKRYANHKYIKLIKSDLDDLSKYQRNSDILQFRRNTDLDIDPNMPRETMQVEEQKDKALVITAYLLPSDTEEVEKDDENGEKLYITRRKYPKGRKVVKINEYIFEDGPIPYDDLEFPYERYVNTPLPREYYGISTVESQRGPQVLFNRILNFTLDVLHLTGNPVWLVPLGSGVNTRKLTNEPGLMIEHNDGNPPVRQEGVQLQPYVLQLIDRLRNWFDDLAGEQDVTRGINPTGITANAAIENLLDAAQKRVKQKIRCIDAMLTQFGRHWLSRCMQFYTVPEIYRLTGKDGVQEYFKFHVEPVAAKDENGAPISLPDGSPKMEKTAIVRKFVKNDLGQMVPSDSQDVYQIRGEFDVRVDTISGLPFAKSENEQRVFNLFDRQIIDAEEVLDRLEYPNKDQILARMKQQQETAAAAGPQAKPA